MSNYILFTLYYSQIILDKKVFHAYTDINKVKRKETMTQSGTTGAYKRIASSEGTLIPGFYFSTVIRSGKGPNENIIHDGGETQKCAQKQRCSTITISRWSSRK